MPPECAAGIWAPQAYSGVQMFLFLKGLDLPGTFVINISGDQIETGAFDKLFNQLMPRFETFAPGYEVNVVTFARISYRMEIMGEPKRFDYLDNLEKSIKLYIVKYLKDWKYDIKVKFVESG